MSAAAVLTVSGSEAAAACGVDPYRSPVALWADKLGLTPERDESEAMRWGTLLQPVVASEVEKRGYVVQPAPGETLRADAYPWLTGHVDAYCFGSHPETLDYRTELGVLEVKTTSTWRRGEWDDDQAPPSVVVQAHVYMMLSGLRWALAAALIGGQRLELREFDYDPEIADIVADKTREFLGYVERQEPPPPDGAAATSEVLARLYPQGTGEVIELTPELYHVAVQREKLRLQGKEIERQQAECDQALRIALGAASVGMYAGAKVVTLSDVTRKAYEVEAKSYRQMRVRVVA